MRAQRRTIYILQFGDEAMVLRGNSQTNRRQMKFERERKKNSTKLLNEE